PSALVRKIQWPAARWTFNRRPGIPHFRSGRDCLPALSSADELVVCRSLCGSTHVGRSVREDVADRLSQAVHPYNGTQGDHNQQQRVLAQVLSAFVTPQALEWFAHGPTKSNLPC